MRKLRKGECYALLRTIGAAIITTKRSLQRCAQRDDGDRIGGIRIKQGLQQVKNISILAFTGLICFIVLFSEAQAQSAGEQAAANGLAVIKPLQIGDTIPEALWNLPLQVVNHPDGKDTITLNDYRDKKLIILDFWNTGCSSCIASFPKIQTLDSTYGNDIAVLLCNTYKRDTQVRISRLLTSSAQTSLVPSSLYNTQLLSYFPHRFIPHLVWIDADGVLLGTTSSAGLSYELIDTYLETGLANLPIKNDNLKFDVDKPVLVNGNGGDDNLFMYRSLLTPEIEGVGTTVGWKTMDRTHTRVFALNQPLFSLMQIGWPKLATIPHNRIAFGDSEAYGRQPEQDQKYCYELICPPNKESSIRAHIRKDLELYFGIHVQEITKDIYYKEIGLNGQIMADAIDRHEPMVQLGKPDRPNIIRRLEAREAIAQLNRFSPVPLIPGPSLSTGQQLISVDLPHDLSNLELVCKALEDAGLSVQDTYGELDLVWIQRSKK